MPFPSISICVDGKRRRVHEDPSRRRRPPPGPGDRFGMLVSVGPAEAGRTTWWIFRCDCGVERRFRLSNVTSGLSSSCGCYLRTHGGCKPRPAHFVKLPDWPSAGSVRHRQDYSRVRRDAVRAEVLAAYGGCCVCCGEIEPAFLTVDHVEGDGHEHRRTRNGGDIYAWLKKHGLPRKGFRLLCYNCNCARGARGFCPHQPEDVQRGVPRGRRPLLT